LDTKSEYLANYVNDTKSNLNTSKA